MMGKHAQGCKRIKAFVLFLLVSGIYGHGVILQRRLEEEQCKPYGHYTANAILTHAQHISDLLLRQPVSLQLGAGRRLIYHDERQLRCWEVEGHNEAGEPCAEYRWDADTGELLCAYVNSPGKEPSARSITDQTAVMRACYSLECLGCGAREEWKLISRPEHCVMLIALQLRRGNQKMIVQIDASDGSFCTAIRVKKLGREQLRTQKRVDRKAQNLTIRRDSAN